MKKLTNSRSIKSRFMRDWDLYLLLLPGVLWFLFFAYLPMLGLATAFYDYNIFKGISGSEFVGFENFVTFLSGADFLRTVKNTIMLAVWQIGICFPAPIILAIIITEIRSSTVRKITQTATFLPHFVSVVVVCSIVINFLSPSTGIFNIIRMKLGLDPIYFMTKPEYFRPIYTTMHLWQNMGFDAIVYIAALMGIDPQLYEAAIVDGAGKWKRILHITIPGILPTVVTMFILKVGKMVKVGYESILLLYQPSTYSTADVISTYAYRLGMENGNFGVATAAGIFEAIIALIMVLFANYISKKVTENSLW